jgi:zona occludens toxin (predicted ATPase)
MAAAIIASVPMVAQAKTPDGVSFPPTMTVDGTTLVLNGTGTRTISYFLDAYASALYVRTKASTPAAIMAEQPPFVVVTKYLHDGTVDQTKAEFRHVYNKFCESNPCSRQSEASFQMVLDHVQPTHVGDQSVTILNNSYSVSLDGRPPFVLNDPEYAKGFIAAILGSASPTPDYANGLLGKE